MTNWPWSGTWGEWGWGVWELEEDGCVRRGEGKVLGRMWPLRGLRPGPGLRPKPTTRPKTPQVPHPSQYLTLASPHTSILILPPPPHHTHPPHTYQGQGQEVKGQGHSTNTHTHTHTHTECVILLLLHYSNFCTHAPECYVIRIFI